MKAYRITAAILLMLMAVAPCALIFADCAITLQDLPLIVYAYLLHRFGWQMAPDVVVEFRQFVRRKLREDSAGH